MRNRHHATLHALTLAVAAVLGGGVRAQTQPDIAELGRTSPEGLTAEQVGARARDTSFDAQAAIENFREAAARVDEAWAQFLPRLTGTGRYSRLSTLTPFAISGSIVATPAPAGTQNPTPTVAENLAFPPVLDNYLLQASFTLPISDYFLRIAKNYSAASRSAEASRHDLAAARAKAYSDGKVVYYSWMRARAAVVVALQSLADQRNHLSDARNQFEAGNANRADVLRAQTNVANAELQLEKARDLSDLSEEQVRIALHVGEEQRLVPGEPLEGPVPPLPPDVRLLTREALNERPELKSLDASILALEKQVAVARAGYFPVLSGFGDYVYANPNERRFPPTSDWTATWDLGVRLTWSPNDVVVASATAREALARAASVRAQKGKLRDGIELEVTQAWLNARQADQAIITSQQELDSASEAYRVARDLFINGRATSTTLTDAETELTRSRLDLLNARADARIARVNLDHAMGRDAHAQ